jgi:hypothetical protein
MSEAPKPPDTPRSVLDDLADMEAAYVELLEKHIRQPCGDQMDFLRNYLTSAERMLESMQTLLSRADTADQPKIQALIDRWHREIPKEMQIYIYGREAQIRIHRLAGVIKPEMEPDITKLEEDMTELRAKYNLVD